MKDQHGNLQTAEVLYGYQGLEDRPVVKVQMVEPVNGEREVCVYPESEVSYIEMRPEQDLNESTPELNIAATSFQALNSKVS